MGLLRTAACGVLVVIGVLGAACTGTFFGSGGANDEPGPNFMGSQTGAGIMPLRRLNRVEYTNTLHDLLGTDNPLAAEFAGENIGPSGYPQGSFMSATEVSSLYEIVDRLARQAVTSNFDFVIGCDGLGPGGESACANEFIARFGRRAYRHPLSALERADAREVYDAARGELGYDFRDAVRMVLKAMLLSPRFHYRWELGDESVVKRADGTVPLSPFQRASALSYFLWQSMPDDELLDAAEKGALTTPVGVRAQAERMLRDPAKGSRSVRGFFPAWLELDRREIAETDASITLRKTALEGTLRFVEDLVLGAGDRHFATLFAADYAFVNEPLAELYGIQGVTGNDFRRVPIDPAVRAGILTQPAFLAATYDTPRSTIIRRGLLIYQKIVLCRGVAPPSGGIPETPPPRAGQSVLQELAAHTENGACHNCHQFMDPLGSPFVGFDLLGRVRTRDENDQPVQTIGQIPDVAGGSVAVTDAADLSRKIAELPEARACLSQQAFQYALRRSSSGRDQGSADAVRDAFFASGGDLRELLLAPTQVHSFYYRTPADGETTQ